MFGLNFSKKTDEFSLSLAEGFLHDFPIEADEKNKSRIKNQKKFNKALKNIDIKIQEYKSSNKLNIYKKARIGNKFMWFLKEHGYAEDLVEEITKHILIKLN